MAQQLYGHADLGFTEFEGGFVFWDRREAEIGAVRAVLDHQSGQWTQWPAWPVPYIVKRFFKHRAALERFPDDVRLLLGLAGWAPERDGAAMIEAWCRLHELELFEAARAVAAEFGGLRLAGWAFVPDPDGDPPGWRGSRWPFALRDDQALCLDPSGAVHLHNGRFVGGTVDQAVISLARGEL